LSTNSIAGSSSVGAATGAATQQVLNNQSLNEQAFLQLLSTQLANQDPTQPQDQSQMLAQLAQFSTVDGVNNMATGQTRLQAQNLLGHQVNALVVNGNTSTPVSGKVMSVSWNGSTTNVSLDNGSTVTINQITQVQP
jgi:flagellar basal-body rod modification protein FlgD